MKAASTSEKLTTDAALMQQFTYLEIQKMERQLRIASQEATAQLVARARSTIVGLGGELA